MTKKAMNGQKRSLRLNAFTVEPKFVFPEGAVEMENTFAMRDNGVEKLTLYEEKIITI